MSTKIYYAVRFPIGNLIEGIDFLHEIAARNVCGNLHAAFEDYPAAAKFFREVRGVIGLSDLLPYECGFNLWIAEDDYVYVIPCGDSNWNGGLFKPGTQEFQSSVPSWIEEFHYQNQSDPPDWIPEEKFQTREAVWDQVCLGEMGTKYGWNARRLSHDVFRASNLYEFWSTEKVVESKAKCR